MPLNSALPQRCVKCNAPTDDPQKKRNLYWHTPIIYITIFIGGILIYLILALCLRKKATTYVSICPQHRASRRTVILIAWLLFLGGIGAFIAAANVNNDKIAPGLVFGGIVALLAGLIYGIGWGRLIYANKITKEHMWIGGCKKEFLASFPEWTGPNN